MCLDERLRKSAPDSSEFYLHSAAPPLSPGLALVPALNKSIYVNSATVSNVDGAYPSSARELPLKLNDLNAKMTEKRIIGS